MSTVTKQEVGLPKGTNWWGAFVLPLKLHGYSLGMPNPGLMPTAKERHAADRAITTTVATLRRAGVDVDGQIVATRHAHRSVVRIVRRRGASRVLLEPDAASRLRRFLEGDLHRQLSGRLGESVAVTTVGKASAGSPAAPE